jgi:hypothetical protein
MEMFMSTEIVFKSEKEKDWLRGVLQEGVVTITFTKKDGDERVIKATLKEDLIPFDMIPKGTSTRKKSEESQSVFDVEKDEWRSFRWDSIKHFSFSIGEEV